MKRYISTHYVFHYEEGSPAERDIKEIAAHQEACFRSICDVLQVEPDFSIQYYLCNTPEEIGHSYGNDVPCNGFARMPDKVYCVYNETLKCIGFHEDAHLISERIGHPEAPAIREGIAMFFDRSWWGIHNQDWTIWFLETGRYLNIQDLLDRRYFFDHDCSITYPLMGAFTDWLIRSFGIGKYRAFFQYTDAREGMKEVYQKTAEEMDQAFTEYMRLFWIDDALRQRMDELLK